VNRMRTLIALTIALIAALVIAACGGGGGNDEDPQQVLTETFSNDQSITSGAFTLDLKVSSEGGTDSGSFEAKLGGPFQGQDGKFPQFDVDADVKLDSNTQNFSGSGGLTSTGDKAYVNFQGTDYEVPQELFDQFTSTFTQLQSQSQANQSNGLLESLGIDPTNWLTDLQNDGTEDVEGTKTIHVSGSADVPKMIEDLKTIADKAGSAAGNVDSSQFDQLSGLVKSADIDVFSGEDDRLLRKLEAKLELQPPAGTAGAPDSVTVELELTLSDVNQPQTIEAPADAQPLAPLLQQLGIDPSLLGSALRGGLGSGGALPQAGGSPTPPSNSASSAYLDCLAKAKGQAALQQCASLLGQ
jgi:hypothetical protein